MDDDRSVERFAALAGLAAAISVGLPPLRGALTGDTPIDGPVPLWWTCYLAYVAAFCLDAFLPDRRPAWFTDAVLVVALTILGCATYLMSAQYGWTGILFVITAVTAAFVWTSRAVAVLIAVQVMVAALGLSAAGGDPEDTVIAALTYGSFQVFAVAMVFMSRKEAAARAELVSAHAELRASSALLAESSRTAERLRISRDLHDVVGHQLTALSLELEVASHHTDGIARDHIVRARDISKELLADVRAAVGQLRVASSSLADPLHALVDGITNPVIALRVVEEATLDEARALVVVRCVQEVVTNTLRHADARHLSIAVSVNQDGARVHCRDDGEGASDPRPGHGLLGMQERLEHLGGALELRTGPGQGFEILATLPAAGVPTA